MDVHPSHFVAIIGGATAGSEAASRLANRGIYTVVFEQNTRPYGKIEDGLPKWHVKLQAQEERKIDEKLSKPNVFFVPKTKLGRDIDFLELVNNWGFSAVLLANGAWRDRPLPVEGADQYIGKGLLYQNPLVFWFNHYHESNYQGEQYEIHDDAIVVGGGLASLDVVKILMLETVLRRLKQRGIRTDLLTLEQKSISAILNMHNLTLNDLGLKGCTLYYRRRIKDMPLAQLPRDATPERIEKVYQAREKILRNFQNKYPFRFQECRVPSGLVVENGRLVGLKFKQTKIVQGKPVVQEGTEYEVRSPLVIASIGSIPEPIPGIEMNSELYEIRDSDSGQLKQFDQVFALGNVVTGKGNIKASLTHGRQVSDHVMDYFLAWREEDYQVLLDRGARDARLKIDRLSDFLMNKGLLNVEKIRSIIEKIEACQKKVGYNGNYQEWIKKNAVEKIEDVIAAEDSKLETESL
jgi:NADPH-dependent glutamate synthase beta subunit-like oxidoreductase